MTGTNVQQGSPAHKHEARGQNSWAVRTDAREISVPDVHDIQAMYVDQLQAIWSI